MGIADDQFKNQLMRGWVNYFKNATGYQKLKDLDSWIRCRLRYCIWKSWKRPKRRLPNGFKPCITGWNPDEPSRNFTHFYNNVVWEQQVENPVRSGFNSLNNVDLHHNLISSLDCALPGGDTACGEGNIVGIDPLFLDASMGDFRTATCSPARNSGSMAAIDELGLLMDLKGEQRLLGTQIDLGAYEQSAVRWGDPTVTPVTCFGTANGSIQLDTLQVVLPAEARWLAEEGSAGTGFDSLPAGMLDFWLEDALGCRDTFQVNIPEPTPIEFSSVVTDASTAQSTDGDISVLNVTGGQPPCPCLWSTEDTTASLQFIPAGDYDLTITDALGCEVTTTFTVNFTTPTDELFRKYGLQLFPNPVQTAHPLQITFMEPIS